MHVSRTHDPYRFHKRCLCLAIQRWTDRALVTLPQAFQAAQAYLEIPILGPCRNLCLDSTILPYNVVCNCFVVKVPRKGCNA